MKNFFLEAALKYHDRGYSVIPIKPGCKDPPLVKWEPFQTSRADRNTILSWWSSYPDANIGVVTGKLSGIIVVDHDKYKPTYSPEIALEYFPDSIITPSSKTPQGGLHMVFRCPDPAPSGRAEAGGLRAIDLRAEGNYIVFPPSRNGNGIAYEWFDGLSLDDVPPAEIPNKYISTLYRDVDTGKQARPQASTLSTSVYMEGRRDQDLFHIANLLVKARCEPEYLYKTLEIIALSCNPPFPLNEVQTKIESALKRAERRERNLMQEVREDLLSTNGVFLSTTLAKRLQLSTREDLKNLSTCLKRAEKEGLCVKYGKQAGSYRTVDREEELIDYLNADLTPYHIKFPLEIQEHVVLHKGNVIVIAGESNAGKTALLLNVAHDNCQTKTVNYMSSEMQNGAELRVRLDDFNYPISSWSPIKFQFRTDNFPDKIQADDLNIVDYLDEGTEEQAWKMPMRIREIADKLKSGVAIVAIQKNPEKEYGFGGAGTLNRARLYLTITTGNILTIKKAKIWRDKMINPNGLFCRFSLVAGCKFRFYDDKVEKWHR